MKRSEVIEILLKEVNKSKFIFEKVLYTEGLEAINSKLKNKVTITAFAKRAPGNASNISTLPDDCKSFVLYNPMEVADVKRTKYFHVQKDGSFNVELLMKTLSELEKESFEIDQDDIHADKVLKIVKKRKEEESKRMDLYNAFIKNTLNSKYLITTDIPGHTVTININNFEVNVSFLPEGPQISHITSSESIPLILKKLAAIQ